MPTVQSRLWAVFGDSTVRERFKCVPWLRGGAMPYISAALVTNPVLSKTDTLLSVILSNSAVIISTLARNGSRMFL